TINVAMDQAIRIGENGDRWKQSEQDQHAKQARLESRPGFALLSLVPCFDQRAEEDERKYQQDHEDGRRERKKKNVLARMGVGNKAEIEGLLGKDNPGQKDQY